MKTMSHSDARRFLIAAAKRRHANNNNNSNNNNNKNSCTSCNSDFDSDFAYLSESDDSSVAKSSLNNYIPSETDIVEIRKTNRKVSFAPDTGRVSSTTTKKSGGGSSAPHGTGHMTSPHRTGPVTFDSDQVDELLSLSSMEETTGL